MTKSWIERRTRWLLLTVLCAAWTVPAETKAQMTELSILDHTRIVRAVQANPFRVLRQLGPEYLLEQDGEPSGREILIALLDIRAVDDFTKSRVVLVLDALDDWEASQVEVPDSTLRALQEVAEELFRSRDVHELSTALKTLRASPRSQDLAVINAISVASDIIEDGRADIYSENSRFFMLLSEQREESGEDDKTPRDHALDVAFADIDGAIGGAVGGCVVGLPGGPPGCASAALTGGVGVAVANSVIEVVGKVRRWLLGS